jgi:hypothetical protein
MLHLLLGGPAHGTQKEIENGQNEVTVFVPSPGNPVPTPFKYIRRDIQAEIRPGTVYQQTIFVEQSVTPDMATQALAATLLQNFAEELVRQFMEGGKRIGSTKESEPSGTDTEQLQRGTSGSGNTASGIVIASR